MQKFAKFSFFFQNNKKNKQLSHNNSSTFLFIEHHSIFFVSTKFSKAFRLMGSWNHSNKWLWKNTFTYPIKLHQKFSFQTTTSIIFSLLSFTKHRVYLIWNDRNTNLHYFYEPFPKQALVFTCLQYKSFENTVGKGEIAHNKQFLLFPQCFLPVWITFCHFHQT